MLERREKLIRIKKVDFSIVFIKDKEIFVLYNVLKMIELKEEEWDEFYYFLNVWYFLNEVIKEYFIEKVGILYFFKRYFFLFVFFLVFLVWLLVFLYDKCFLYLYFKVDILKCNL